MAEPNENPKLTQLKLFLDISGTEQDDLLTAYLTFAKDEILSWLYSGKTPEGVTDVPARYEAVQIQAVIAGYSMRGAESQLHHNENGIVRIWKYEDMVAYIRSHVTAQIGVY